MGKSCLIRLAAGFLVFVVSSLAGGLVILAATWLYPSINPQLYSLLQSNQFPYPSDTLWAFWTAVPCCLNLVFAAALGFGINLILRRIRPAGQGE